MAAAALRLVDERAHAAAGRDGLEFAAAVTAAADALLSGPAARQRRQYVTGTGSRLRQMYQVATEQYGVHASATSRASARDTGSPLK